MHSYSPQEFGMSFVCNKINGDSGREENIFWNHIKDLIPSPSQAARKVQTASISLNPVNCSEFISLIVHGFILIP